MSGCKSTKGLCGHDKMMILMGSMMAAFAVLHWGLRIV
jgi:hypothetical protein